MANAPEFVLWLDLETAGTDEHDPILEVGAILCRNEPGHPIISRRSWVPRLPEPELTRLAHSMPPVVVEMHDNSGLWEELCTIAHSTEPDLGAVDYRCAQWLRSNCGSTHVALAGSGVAHFDRRFIRAQMPRTDKRLTYWAYDVGVIRRFFGATRPDLVRPLPSGRKAHRALLDAEDHRLEWLHYQQVAATLPG